jgi:zinc and cadmium transporter
VTAALVLAAGALLGAFAPGLGGLWDRHRDTLLTGSAGLLIGTAALHLLPEATVLGPSLGYALLAGFLGVLVLEAIIHVVLPSGEAHDHHRHDDVGHDHEEAHLHHVGVDAHETHLSISAGVGFSLHGLVDGVGLEAASHADGVWLATAALLAHHVPLAISCASLLKLGGMKRAFWPVMVVCALMPVPGVLLASAMGAAAAWLSGIAAGVFLYVASHNLLPLMDRNTGTFSRVVVLLSGTGLALLTKLLSH